MHSYRSVFVLILQIELLIKTKTHYIERVPTCDLDETVASLSVTTLSSFIDFPDWKN